MSNMEYLALPYTHEDEEVMCYRAAVSDFIFSELSKEGRIVYAPISSCHYIAIKHSLPTDFEFWKKMCRAFVGVADRVVVIVLPGIEESTGLQAELQLAKELYIPVTWLDPEPYIEKNEELREWKLKLEKKQDMSLLSKALA